MIEQAEVILRELGFSEVRVRHHEAGPVALIEVPAEVIGKLNGTETFDSVEASLKAIGYARVMVDERGYRRGSLNIVAHASSS